MFVGVYGITTTIVSIIQCRISVTAQSRGNGLSWQASLAGVIKLNVDAAFSSSREEASLGVVARNSRDKVLFSVAEKWWSTTTFLQAEFLAISKGLCAAKEFHFQSVIHESDYLLAINEINRHGSSCSEWGGLTIDILEATHNFQHCLLWKSPF
ncbi:hypothetical protein PTKIN_Ptkin18bG0039400 [Pterospermum kingtungense]